MVTINIIWLVLFFSLILILSGIYFKKKALILVLVGSLMVLITGILTFSDPISYVLVNETYVYDVDKIIFIEEDIILTPINDYINYLLSSFMMLLGLAGVIGSSITLYNQRYDEEP